MEKLKIEAGTQTGVLESDSTDTPAKQKPRINFLKGKIRFLGHFIHIAFLLLAVAEVAVFVGASFVALEILYGLEQSRPALSVLLPEIVSAALILICSMAAMGLHHARQREPLGGILLRIGAAFILGVSLIIALNLLIQDLFTGREHFLALFVGLSLIGLGILRMAFYKYVDGRIMKRHVLVIGTGEKANKFMRLRRKSDQRGFTVKGFVRLSTNSNVCVHSPQIVSLEKEALCEYALETGIDEIVIALDDRHEELPAEELIECRMNGIEISDILHFFEREAGKILVDVVKPSWFIHSDGFRFNYLRTVSKRLFDIVASLLLLVLFVPVIAVTILAIWIENGAKGPILYLQRRVGARGKRFNVIKFRSMVADAEKDGVAQWATKNDSRVTRVGAVIRKFRIDEIPQLLNVLLGQMSLVGPRPERPEFVSELSEEIPYYNERHRVKPGLTGWAQSCYPYGSSAQDSVEKLQYDLFYVKNHTFLLDLFILLQTAEVVLFGKGAR
jgi:sugar transferase (PEP-CTERM system associated)